MDNLRLHPLTFPTIVSIHNVMETMIQINDSLRYSVWQGDVKPVFQYLSSAQNLLRAYQAHNREAAAGIQEETLDFEDEMLHEIGIAGNAKKVLLDLFTFQGGENLVALKEAIERRHHIISNKQLIFVQGGGTEGFLVYNITGLFLAFGPDGGRLLCSHCTGCSEREVHSEGLHFLPIRYFRDPVLCKQVLQLYTAARRYLIGSGTTTGS